MKYLIKSILFVSSFFIINTVYSETCPSLENVEFGDGEDDSSVKNLPDGFRVNSYAMPPRDLSELKGKDFVFKRANLPTNDSNPFQNNSIGPFVNIPATNPLYCYYASKVGLTSIAITKNEARWLYRYYPKTMNYNLGKGWKYLDERISGLIQYYSYRFTCEAGDDCSFEWIK